LEPVYETTFCSTNQAYCAHSTVSPNHLVKGFITDDGRTVVSIYPGLNLLPTDATLDFVLVRLLRAKGHVDEVHLRSLYSDIADLPHSDSHLYWGGWVGIENGKLVLERADRSRWRSDRL
jgi:hypothetical protein